MDTAVSRQSNPVPDPVVLPPAARVPEVRRTEVSGPTKRRADDRQSSGWLRKGQGNPFHHGRDRGHNSDPPYRTDVRVGWLFPAGKKGRFPLAGEAALQPPEKGKAVPKRFFLIPDVKTKAVRSVAPWGKLQETASNSSWNFNSSRLPVRMNFSFASRLQSSAKSSFDRLLLYIWLAASGSLWASSIISAR